MAIRGLCLTSCWGLGDIFKNLHPGRKGGSLEKYGLGERGSNHQLYPGRCEAPNIPVCWQSRAVGRTSSSTSQILGSKANLKAWTVCRRSTTG